MLRYTIYGMNSINSMNTDMNMLSYIQYGEY